MTRLELWVEEIKKSNWPRGTGPAHAGGNSDTMGEAGTALDVEDEQEEELREPGKFAVVLHNDDYTTMEFVVEVLHRYFQKSAEEAVQVMLRVHQQGKGVAGIYTYDIAETKALQVTEYARASGFPLKCSVEKC
jgi:ATP-dependent Clp protease adaptor protein ClpS